MKGGCKYQSGILNAQGLFIGRTRIYYPHTGESFLGYLLDNKKETFGVETDLKQRVYKGFFSGDIRSGFGEIKEADAETCQGVFVDGHLQGEVFKTNPNGLKSRVIFEDGSQNTESSEEISTVSNS